MKNYFNYFSEIETTFVRRRGRNLLLSPLDWALIEGWKERDIPLHIVVAGIDAIFDGIEQQNGELGRRRGVKSLMYCRDEVEARYAAWSEMQTGADESHNGNGSAPHDQTAAHIAEPANISPTHSTNDNTNGARANFSRAEVVAHINRAAVQLEKFAADISGASDQQLPQAVAEVKSKINQVQRRLRVHEPSDYEKLEAILNDLDQRLDQVLPLALTAEQAAELRRETKTQLRPYHARMKPEMYEQTVAALVGKTLRERFDLPRFSLFYL